MEILPITPMVDSFSRCIPAQAKRKLINKQQYYLKSINILQESYEVYQSKSSLGICFTLRDYGFRDLYQIGFTLIIETRRHCYRYQKAFSSVYYQNDNQFLIHIVDLDKTAIKRCYLIIDWVLYADFITHQRDACKLRLEEEFKSPDQEDFEYIYQVDTVRSRCISNSTTLSSKKAQFDEEALPTAWRVYRELNTLFSELSSNIECIRQNHKTLCLSYPFENTKEELIPVPISCYFDKGFYSALYYAKDYPIIEKRFSGGQSAIQCVVGVNKSHLDVLLYLFYCTVDQRRYYQYLSDEQINLQQYLETNHPIVKLKKQLQNISQQYSNSHIVLKADIYQEAHRIVEEYFAMLKIVRENAYSELRRKRQTHGKWVNEYKLFTLVRVLFPDAVYQYSAEWLKTQTIDIFIPSINCALEYHGEQHYLSVEYFGGEKKLTHQAKMDTIKRDKCNAQGVSLFEWPYYLQINMPSVCSFFHESMPEVTLSDEILEYKVAAFPIENMSEFLCSTNIRKKSESTTKTKRDPRKVARPNTHEIRKYDVTGKYLKSYSSISEAAEKEMLSVGGISKVIYGERRTAGGFQWKRCVIDSPKLDIDAIIR